MKITTVSWRRSSTLNVGDFESVRIEAGATAELDDGDDPREVFAAIQAEVGEQLSEAAMDVRRRAKKREERRRKREGRG